MSTYLDPRYPEKHSDYSDVPEDVQAFLRYLESTLRRSPRTVNAYYVDLRIFLRFMVRYQQQIDKKIPDSELVIHDLDTTFWRTINYADLLEYTIYLKNERNNSRATNCRKVSSIKGFFRYLTKMGKISDDPSKELDLPKPARSLPKYLSLEESLELLKDIQSDFYEREYCMLTLFLNCGMRLSELVSINLSDFKDDTIRITGKGSKQRLVYLNPACVDAVKQYLAARAKLENLKDKQALFVSRRTGRSLSPRRADRKPSAEMRRFGWLWVFSAQTSAHSGHPDVPARAGRYADAEGDPRARTCFHHGDLYSSGYQKAARCGEFLSSGRGKNAATLGSPEPAGRGR